MTLIYWQCWRCNTMVPTGKAHQCPESARPHLRKQPLPMTEAGGPVYRWP